MSKDIPAHIIYPDDEIPVPLTDPVGMAPHEFALLILGAIATIAAVLAILHWLL